MSTSATAVPQWKVEVWLYDLSQGMARAMSMAFLGKQIDAIYHTGVVVYGWESVQQPQTPLLLSRSAFHY